MMFRTGSGTMTEQWLTQEQEYFAVAFAIFFFKCRRAATLQQVVEKALMFGKLFAIAVLLKLHCLWVGGAYCFLCAMVSTLVPPPPFGGAEDIEDLTRTSFASRVRAPESAEDKKTVRRRRPFEQEHLRRTSPPALKRLRPPLFKALLLGMFVFFD
jgi:hypothetical protein